MYTYTYHADNRSGVIAENGTEVITLTGSQEQVAGFVRWLNCVNPQQPGEEQLSIWFMRFLRSNPSVV